MRDWRSDGCSSDLQDRRTGEILAGQVQTLPIAKREAVGREIIGRALLEPALNIVVAAIFEEVEKCCRRAAIAGDSAALLGGDVRYRLLDAPSCRHPHHLRSEEHTSELPSLMRTSYAVLCSKKKKLSPLRNPRRTRSIQHRTTK